MNKTEKRRLKLSLIPPAFFLVVMWITKIIEYSMDYNLYIFGIFPLSVKNIPGIFLAPFIHGDFEHLLSNSIPFLFLGTSLFYFYREFAYKVFFLLYFFSGFWVWLAAREAYHIGASGMVYGLASFLFFSGLIHKNRALASLSLIIVFLYGSMVWGILPTQEGISWEGHLFGAITGLILTLAYANKKPFSNHKKIKPSDDLKEFSEPMISNDEYDHIFYQYTENDE